MRKFLGLLTLVALVGCTPIPEFSLEHSLDSVYTMQEKMFNVASSDVSEFDNSRIIRVDNIRCDNIGFALYQDTPKFERGVVLLNAGIANKITNIGDEDSLQIKLDGKLYEFSPTSRATEYDKMYFAAYNQNIDIQFSHKSYVVPFGFVEAAANAAKILVRITMLNNTYLDGNCSVKSMVDLTAEERKIFEDANMSEDQIQKSLKAASSSAGINGFRKFVELRRVVQ